MCVGNIGLLPVLKQFLMCVCVELSVYVPNKIQSDKFKTRKEKFLDKEILKEDEKETIIRKFSVIVKLDLCWMISEIDDCEFDHGGYFLIKGAEKVGLYLIFNDFRLNLISCFDFLGILFVEFCNN